jgi:hypothetical protein
MPHNSAGGVSALLEIGAFAASRSCLYRRGNKPSELGCSVATSFKGSIPVAKAKCAPGRAASRTVVLCDLRWIRHEKCQSASREIKHIATKPQIRCKSLQRDFPLSWHKSVNCVIWNHAPTAGLPPKNMGTELWAIRENPAADHITLGASIPINSRL